MKLKEGWKKIKLLDCYEVTNGLSKNRGEFGFGYPFLTFKEVFNDYFLPENLDNLANSTDKEREKCSIKRGDIFITRTSETMEELGITSVSLKDYPNATFNGFTKRLRPKTDIEIFPEFISFYLRSRKFRNQIQCFVSLTTRASLNNEMLEKLELIIPNIEKQKKIAKILKNLYDKIKINNEMNKTLEEMAQTLFKRWFIDFDFPNENGEPYKSSGGKMVDSELGEIPEGWEVKSLLDIADYLNGLAMQKYRPQGKENLKVIKIKEMNNGFSLDSDLCCVTIPEKYKIENGDILFSWSGTLKLMLWNGKTGGLNQHIFKVTSEKFEKWFIYLWTKIHLNDFIHVAESKATTMGHIKRENLKEAQVIIPRKDVILKMDKTMIPILEKIVNCNKEIQYLKEIRDILLSKLMNGEVEV